MSLWARWLAPLGRRPGRAGEDSCDSSSGSGAEASVLRCRSEGSGDKVACFDSEESGDSSGSSKEEDEYELRVMKQISLGQRTMRHLRIKTGSVLFLLGLVLGIAAVFFWHIEVARLSASSCISTAWDHVVFMLVDGCLLGRLICFGLVPLAGDVRMTRMILILDLSVLGVVLISFGLGYSVHRYRAYVGPPTGLMKMVSVGIDFSAVLYGCLTLIGIFFRDGMRMQRFMWFTIAVSIALMTPLKVVQCIQVTISCHNFTPIWWVLPSYALGFYISVSAHFRERVHAMLNSSFEKRSAHRGAAGIAALVGNCPPDVVLRSSVQRFRAISIGELTFQDVFNNEPNPKLNALSFRVRLEECDAFLSHSWHDDPRSKWQALQRWRDEFTSTEGREPKVWFDKCCIDQSNIDADLRCLPVFLSGCQKLVVLCGPTYLSRLWCMMELFTYVHIGRSLDEIEFIRVGGCRKSGDAESQASVRDSFASFDARGCSCYHQQDKDRMLCMIKAAFGSLDKFNDAVRSTFVTANWRIWSLKASSNRSLLAKMACASPDDGSPSENGSPVHAMPDDARLSWDGCAYSPRSE